MFKEQVKLVKRGCLILLCVFFVFMFSTCHYNCIGMGLRIYQNDIFIYSVGYDSNEVMLLGLTDTGQNLQHICIPKKIDGKKVNTISTNGYIVKKIIEKYGDEKYGHFSSDKLEKLYIISDLVQIELGKCPNLKGCYISTKDINISPLQRRIGDGPTEIFTVQVVSGNYGETIRGNVLYMYNYDNAENDGYYLVDNYDYGSKIDYIPPIPERDNHTFAGWYKEPECINKWDFYTDKLPELKHTNNGEEIFEETKLYAKWILKIN